MTGNMFSRLVSSASKSTGDMSSLPNFLNSSAKSEANLSYCPLSRRKQYSSLPDAASMPIFNIMAGTGGSKAECLIPESTPVITKPALPNETVFPIGDSSPISSASCLVITHSGFPSGEMPESENHSPASRSNLRTSSAAASAAFMYALYLDPANDTESDI